MISVQKNRLASKIAVTAAFLGMFSALTPAVAQDAATPAPQPKITVDANGSVSVKPDMALLQVSVANEAKTAKKAADQTNSGLKKVLAALEKFNIAEKDLQSNGLTVNTVYHRQDPKEKPEKMFRASVTLDLKIRDTQQLGGLIDAVIANGATGVSDVTWTNSNLKPLYSEARQKAVAMAMEKTKTYAEAAGLTPGRVLTIEETSGERPTPRFYARAQPSMVMAADTPVAQGEQDYSVRITVTQELVNGNNESEK